MKKSLTAIGGSLGIIIDKPIAELYQLDRHTEIEITPKEDGINIRFIKKSTKDKETTPQVASDEEVMKAAKDINKRYAKMMKKLAK